MDPYHSVILHQGTQLVSTMHGLAVRRETEN